mmetsp:Transcript_4239/g.8819  ORF Transcript_4239/g.8819 Transcript_4239/m.8819 type:complete len:247 (-) Transcript_4239:78-818(-)
MQVQEHPVLGALQLYLTKTNSNSNSDSNRVSALVPLTRDAGGPTPCLVTNVPRMCAIDTSASMRVPRGLYGRCFAIAKGDDVLAQTTIFSDRPPRYSNILAVEAPKPNRGSYTDSQISDILCTAYSGFLAARSDSIGSSVDGDGIHVVRVHTGHWGCGAYGGNKQLMAILQVLAAHLAGVELSYHAFDAAGAAEVQRGLSLLGDIEREMMPGTGHDGGEAGGRISLPCLVARLVGHRFRWGTSDGN